MRPNVSVIIPVYNSIKTICSLMDSINQQFLENVEYICIDDASTDGSYEMMLQYAESNPAIKVIKQDKNMGDCLSRINAVRRSSGKYIMFADADDVLYPEFTRTAFEMIEKENVDVLQFSADINYVNGLSQEGIVTDSKILPASPRGKIESETNLLDSSCWNSMIFRFYVWNKIYNGDLTRKIAEEMVYERTISSDYYFNLLFSLQARSYASISDSLYIYNFGGGITALEPINLDKFNNFLTPRLFFGDIERVLSEHDKDYSAIILETRRHFINTALERVFKWLTRDCISEGFRRTVETWGFDEVMDAISASTVQKRSEMIEVLKKIDLFKAKEREKGKKLTIASYYPKLSNGGVERVIASLTTMLAEEKTDCGDYKYNVVIITNESTDDSVPEFEYSDKIKREYLTAVSDDQDYTIRSKQWRRIISENDIDIVIESEWANTAYLTDTLCIKGHEKHPYMINHFHNFVGELFRFRNSLAKYMSEFYGFVDGVVVLSKADERFVRSFSKHSKCISNPMTFEKCAVKPIPEKNSILWAGRFVKEKQPFEAILAMKKVISRVPDAILYMVGTGNEDIYNQCRDLIETLELQDNIIMPGFSSNIREYYEKAELFLQTSLSEGFGLTLYEASSFGVPVVMYDLPWLPFAEKGKGVITVEQLDNISLAEAIVKILSDSNLREKLSQEALEFFEETSTDHILEDWEEFIDEVMYSETSNHSNEYEDILFREIIKKQNDAKILWQKEIERETVKTNRYFRQMEQYSEDAERLRKESAENWAARNKALDEAKANWDARNKALEEAAANWAARNKAVEESAANWEARNKAIDEAKANWAARNKAIDEAAANWAARNKALEEAKANWSARNKAVDEAAANWAARNKAVEEAKANWAARNKAVEEAKANWAARNKALEEAKANWEARNKAVEEAKANWAARNKALEEASANWTARNKAIEEAKINWQKRTEAIEIKNKAIAEKDRAIRERNDIKESFNSLKDEFSNLEIEFNDIKDINSEKQERIEELQTRYDELEFNMIELEKKYKELTEHWSYKLFGKKNK